jgi:hypothetical protein
MSFIDENEVDDEDMHELPASDGPRVDMKYLREKLVLAVLSASTDDRSWPLRVHGAFQHFGLLEIADFPCDLRGDVLRIRSMVPKGTPLLAALSSLNEEQLRRVVSGLVFLSDAVSARAAQSLQDRTAFGTR